MKFSEIPENVQEVAAELLSEQLVHYDSLGFVNRTDKSKEIAETVREAFVKLYE
ncbi:hypothetical protein N5923_23505 [Erwiniaceae bacterium BAC15a-03b]|uniref:Uncharacterized protein n=1 Tax=Winslowiella arboricola TaxID=2978220 RepID=A0A9J6Q2H9_9GAMM|nr:hypothetical protein [Winslowiella arboricola]MCU5775083.1 hypothetical protein [Winslowiella arboricola]MCU5780463.1 hypothetical protein [Winslowiella arboricola]